MILVDANLLIYSFHAGLPHHHRAKRWLDGELNGGEGVGMPWPSLLAFVRLSSNPKVFERAVSVGLAWQQVEDWLSLDSTWIPGPTLQHRSTLRNLVQAMPDHHSQQVMDAHLAALAIDHDLLLCSADQDFARFDKLRWKNPLTDR